MDKCPKCRAAFSWGANGVIVFLCGTISNARGLSRSDKCRFAELEAKVIGLEKANELYRKGMESQCELQDGLKQQVRELKAENARLNESLAAVSISESDTVISLTEENARLRDDAARLLPAERLKGWEAAREACLRLVQQMGEPFPTQGDLLTGLIAEAIAALKPEATA